MSTASDSQATRRKRVRRVIVLAAVSLAGLAVVLSVLISRPRGPLAETLRGHSWKFVSSGITVGEIRFEASGAYELSLPPGIQNGSWTVQNDQLVIDPHSRFVRTLNELFGKSPLVSRSDVVSMTADRVELANRQNAKITIDVVLIRISRHP